MILVRNHRPRLSGSKLVSCILILNLFLSACGIFSPSIPQAPEKPEPGKPSEPPTEKEETKKVVEAEPNKVVLILPLQLDRLHRPIPTREEVKRAEIPLDFYQGFRLGIDRLAKEGYPFQVTVLDSRDNASQSAALGRSDAVQSADLVVGPIFPKEIQAFGEASTASKIVQVSPLAASTPAEFNIANLVSLVAPVAQHARGLIDYLQQIYRKGDQIIIYNTEDSESHKFLDPIKTFLREASLPMQEITSLEGAEEIGTLEGRNLFIVGTTNRFAVHAVLSELNQLQTEMGLRIELFGHPNWSKLSLDPGYLENLHTKITSSFYVDHSSRVVRDFEQDYRSQFEMDPSEYAYKGYDTGYFFGRLLTKYGSSYTQSLENETYNGLQTNYIFEKNPTWGFVNTYIHILQFDGVGFRPVKK